MVTINLPYIENNFVSQFSIVGREMGEEARSTYMFNLCTNQVGSVIDEIHLQLYVQGCESDEEVAVFLSSAISDDYPVFQPNIHTDPLGLIEECRSFLIEEWGRSAITVGLERGWFINMEEGGVNMMPSYPSYLAVNYW